MLDKSPNGRSFHSVGKLGVSSCSLQYVCHPLYRHSNCEHLLRPFRKIYMCINHPKWHKILVTTTSIIVVQLSSFILLFLVLGLANIPIFQELFQNKFFSSWGFKLVGSLFVGFMGCLPVKWR